MQKNRIEIAGFLAAKPMLRYLPSGTPVANVRLGESYTFKDSDGKSQKHSNWHSLSFYGDLSTVAMTFEKGDNIFVEGSIEQRQFTPKDGVQRTVQEVVVRTCHIIAPPRRNGVAKASTRGEAAAEEERETVGADAVDHDLWPVA
jgi:single-strand DNA-binding protein